MAKIEQAVNQDIERQSSLHEGGRNIAEAVARSILAGVIEPVRNTTKMQIEVLRNITNKLDIDRSQYSSYSNFISRLPAEMTSKLFSAFTLRTPVAGYIRDQAREKLKNEGLLEE